MNGGPDDDGRTVFQPGFQPGSPDNDDRLTSSPLRAGPTALSSPRLGIKPGDILNHIFEVKRFIARGGMGEVFEGANVITDERVAIKVVLPALAADPNVISLFHREARTLTHLHHEAVVQYRVLAQEPQLGVLYIVTEYIEGAPLSEALATLQATPDQLAGLLRRLASGLRAAHALGAIHRDMSPDNVLLGRGQLERAKIIDFGIAKDLDPGTATIVGDGFAGKLGYVAPEQLGDFGRRLGPWTDVYSLGLVILAVAAGRDVGLGGSLVDAVDKRRAGPDLSAAPPGLRGVLERMTRADPDARLSSMDAVLADLDRATAPPPVPAARTARPGWLVPAVGVLAAVLLLTVALLTLGGRQRGSLSGPATIASARPSDAVALARNTINAALPSVACTWLGVGTVRRGPRGVEVGLTGVAGDPSAAQAEIGRALKDQGIAHADLDFAEVAPITQPGCAVLDAYRQIRGGDTGRLSAPQRKFEMRHQPPGSAYAGELAAEAVIGIAPDVSQDFTLVALEPSGKLTPLFVSRAAFTAEVARSVKGVPLAALGGDRYRLTLDLDHQGWSGLLLLTGKGPFAADVVAPVLGARGPDWRDKLVAAASGSAWRADMLWFKSVDEVKD